jgi:benzoate-CoA ligase family protein
LRAPGPCRRFVRASMDLPELFNVAEYFVDRHLEEGREDQVAVFYGEEQLTYRQISELVSRAANALGQYGVTKGDRVLILLPDSPAYVAAFWGAIKLGAVAVPLNTLLTGEELGFVLRDSGARCLVAYSTLLDKADAALRSLGGVGKAGCGLSAAEPRVFVAGGIKRGYEDFDDAVARSARHAESAPVSRDEPAFWLYTSGSTGEPKAVVHRHRDMVCCLENFAKGVLGMTAKDRTFSASKLFFAYGLGNGLYFPFGVGAQTVLLPGRANAERVLEVISRYRPTLFFGVPGLYAAILEVSDASRDDLSSLRCAISAGEALPAPLWERFRQRFAISILDGIGSTEMLHMFISNRPEDIMPGSSGKIVPGYAARIVDEEGRESRTGDIGNLWIRGESAAAGYWNRPELTQAVFRGGWVVTGDKYRCDERGYYWHCGRSDDMLKVHGMWVSPVEVESAIVGHPAVMECAVVGAMDDDGLEKPKAFLVLKAPLRWSAELEAEVRKSVRDKLAKYKEPRWLVQVDSLPKTATGKLQRFKLREHRPLYY